ncbi:MAG TPA: type II toxin-antitoxin system HicA family toxin [Acidobacteriaceae bacterium]|jgi:predicted RNA binding protein YcfA (HicA-like mRNA interferase family)|nr:type II toxin-antitoxin system HicA family toxin [Acidobacteriaceae bacterium]
MPLTAREIIRKIEAIGWRFLRQKGSHRVFVHDSRPGLVVVPVHKGDLPYGTERKILKDAGLL